MAEIDSTNKKDFAEDIRLKGKHNHRYFMEGIVTGVEIYHRPYTRSYYGIKYAALIIFLTVENQEFFTRAWLENWENTQARPFGRTDEMLDIASLEYDYILGLSAKVSGKANWISDRRTFIKVDEIIEPTLEQLILAATYDE